MQIKTKIQNLHLRFRLWLMKFLIQKHSALNIIVVSLIPVIIILFMVAIAIKYRISIINHLIIRNIKPDNTVNDLIPVFCTTIGASLLGVLAISFSFTMFSVQQAADKHIVSILKNSTRDKVSTLIYSLIALFAFCFFVFAIFPTKDNFILIIFSSLLMIIFTLFLLPFQFRHTINRINPSYQINQYYNNSIKELERINKLFSFGITLYKNKEDMINIQENQVKLNIFFHNPEILNNTKHEFEKIYTTIIAYINRKDYQVTSDGLNAINNMLFKYIDIKNGAFMPSSLIHELDLSHDDFLQNALEKLSDVQKIAVQSNDLEVSRQVLDSLTKIALKCIEIDYGKNVLNEYCHCMLVTYYLNSGIKSCLNAGLYDIGIQGSESLRMIGQKLIIKDSKTDILTIFDYLAEIVMFSFVKPEVNYLISSPLKVFSILLRNIVQSKIRHSSVRLLAKVRDIIDLYIKEKEPTANSTDMEFSLGCIISMTYATAIPYIFNDFIKIIENPNTENEIRKDSISIIIEFSYHLRRFYDDLSKSAAENESFMIKHINSNIFHISSSLLYLYNSSFLNVNDKRNIIERISWFISNYWRIYDYHKQITHNYEFLIIENLLRLGYEFNKLSLFNEFLQVLDIIYSIAKSFHNKKQNNGFKQIEILENGCYLCILNSDETIWERYITKIKSGFWDDYIIRFPLNKDLIFDELLELDPVHLRINNLNDSFDDYLISQLDEKQIIKFVGLLKMNLIPSL